MIKKNEKGIENEMIEWNKEYRRNREKIESIDKKLGREK